MTKSERESRWTSRIELIHALVDVMSASSLDTALQLEAAWITMQIVGGQQAANVMRSYLSINDAKS